MTEEEFIAHMVECIENCISKHKPIRSEVNYMLHTFKEHVNEFNNIIEDERDKLSDENIELKEKLKKIMSIAE